MKVKELIEELQALNPELELVLQSDPEGNGYYELSGAEETMLDGEGNALHPDDYADSGETKAVVLFP